MVCPHRCPSALPNKKMARRKTLDARISGLNTRHIAKASIACKTLWRDGWLSFHTIQQRF